MGEDEYWEQEIYRAEEYAESVFKDTKSEDNVIIQVKASVGVNVEDSIYIIRFKYTTGDNGEAAYYKYKILVEDENFKILEEGSDIAW